MKSSELSKKNLRREEDGKGEKSGEAKVARNLANRYVPRSVYFPSSGRSPHNLE